MLKISLSFLPQYIYTVYTYIALMASKADVTFGTYKGEGLSTRSIAGKFNIVMVIRFFRFNVTY